MGTHRCADGPSVASSVTLGRISCGVCGRHARAFLTRIIHDCRCRVLQQPVCIARGKVPLNPAEHLSCCTQVIEFIGRYSNVVWEYPWFSPCNAPQGSDGGETVDCTTIKE